jgi:alpha-tubulin suppressor-like RCC1 family protein
MAEYQKRTFSRLISWMTLCLVAVGCGPNDPDGPTPENDSWVQVAVGGRHTCAIQVDGSVWCWGAGEYGQLGDGTTEGGSRPRWVQLLLGATDVAAGDAHTCIVVSDGSVWCWGKNNFGQLGDGTAGNRAGPTPVTLPGMAVRVVAGYAHTCAVGMGGQLWCWGANETGQLGIGNAVPDTCGTPAVSCSLSPLGVEALSGVTSAAAGGTAEGSHGCALLQDRSIWCWGDNSEEQLGDGGLISRNTPVELTDLFSVANITAGQRHTCATLVNGEAHCWGRSFGSPFWISALENVERVSAGGDFSCSILADATSWCWGINELGQLGDATYDDRVYPSQVVGVRDTVGLSAGSAHACAVTDAGQLWCWGSNGDGQLSGTIQLHTNLPTRVMN